MVLLGDDRPYFYLHHHRVGDRWGSWLHHVLWGEHHASAKHQLYPRCGGSAHYWTLHQEWHGKPHARGAYRRSANVASHTHLHELAIALQHQLNVLTARPFQDATQCCERKNLRGCYVGAAHYPL